MTHQLTIHCDSSRQSCDRATMADCKDSSCCGTKVGPKLHSSPPDLSGPHRPVGGKSRQSVYLFRMAPRLTQCCIESEGGGRHWSRLLHPWLRLVAAKADDDGNSNWDRTSLARCIVSLAPRPPWATLGGPHPIRSFGPNRVPL